MQDEKSFAKVKQWNKSVMTQLRGSPREPLLVLMGNKIDEDVNLRQVSEKQGQKLADAIGARFVEISLLNLGPVRLQQFLPYLAQKFLRTELPDDYY
jgi:hypothetical protein